MPAELHKIVDQIKRHPKLVIADDFEISIQRTNESIESYTQGTKTKQQCQENLWVSLRLLHRKQPGQALSLENTESVSDSLVDRAFESARQASVDPWFRFPIFRPVPTRNSRDPVLVESTLKERMNIEQVHVEEHYQTTQIESQLYRKSDGKSLSYSDCFQEFSLSVLARGQAGIFRVREKKWAGPEKFVGDNLIHRMKQQIEALQSASEWTGQSELPVLMGGKVVARLLESFSLFFCADRIESQRVGWATRVGERLFSEQIDIVDGSETSDGPYVPPIDLEGTPTKPKTLVSAGRLQGLLYDSYWGARFNVGSTGSLLRSSGELQGSIRPSFLSIVPGKHSLKSLCQKMGSGVWLEDVEDLSFRSTNPGQASLIGSGWRVHQGNCLDSVFGVALDVNLFDLLKLATGVGVDFHTTSSCGAPSILFPKMPLRRA